MALKKNVTKLKGYDFMNFLTFMGVAILGAVIMEMIKHGWD